MEQDMTLLDDHGFSLIELMIALAIFSIGMMAISSMLMTSGLGNSKAFIQTEVATLASDRIVTLMALPYNDAALTAGTYGTAVDPATDGVDNDDDGTLDEAGETGTINTITWTITDDTPIDNTKTIQVTTITTRRGGKTVTLQMIKEDTI